MSRRKPHPEHPRADWLVSEQHFNNEEQCGCHRAQSRGLQLPLTEKSSRGGEDSQSSNPSKRRLTRPAGAKETLHAVLWVVVRMSLVGMDVEVEMDLEVEMDVEVEMDFEVEMDVEVGMGVEVVLLSIHSNILNQTFPIVWFPEDRSSQVDLLMLEQPFSMSHSVSVDADGTVKPQPFALSTQVLRDL